VGSEECVWNSYLFHIRSGAIPIEKGWNVELVNTDTRSTCNNHESSHSGLILNSNVSDEGSRVSIDSVELEEQESFPASENETVKRPRLEKIPEKPAAVREKVEPEIISTGVALPSSPFQPSYDMPSLCPSMFTKVADTVNIVKSCSLRLLSLSATRSLSNSEVSDISTLICEALDSVFDTGLGEAGVASLLPESTTGTRSCVQQCSGLVFITSCLRLLDLSHSRISDELIWAVAVCYMDSSARSSQYVALFLCGVVLQRLRHLTSPASRMMMKTIDMCVQRHPEESITFILGPAPRSPPLLCTVSQPAPIDPVVPRRNNFQWECIQRLIRQKMLVKEQTNELLLHILGLPQTFTVSQNTMCMAKSHEVSVLDALLNADPNRFSSLFTIAENGFQRRVNEFWALSVSVSIDDEASHALVPASDSFAELRVRHSDLEPEVMPILASICTSSMKSLSLEVLSLVIAHLDTVTGNSQKVAALPVLANLIHSIIQSHPNILDTCRGELKSILQRSSSMIARNTLSILST